MCDVSGSMADSGKLAFLKAELAESINSLMEHMSYVICPFSTEAFMLGGPGQVDSSRGGWQALGSRQDRRIECPGGHQPGTRL